MFKSIQMLFIGLGIFALISVMIWSGGDVSSMRPGKTSGNEVVATFRQAKRNMIRVYRDHPFTFYCTCRFDRKWIDHLSCGFKPHRRKNRRAHRMEWEHIVPAHRFGQSFVEWRHGHPSCRDSGGRSYKGRKCVRKVSDLFRRIEADMYNLVPSIGEVNQIRANKPVGLVADSRYDFGKCPTKVGFSSVEPADQVKGFVARTYMYMEAAYPGRGIVGRKNRKLFEAWNRQFPPSEFEIQRARRISRIQRNENRLVIDYRPSA